MFVHIFTYLHYFTYSLVPLCSVLKCLLQGGLTSKEYLAHIPFIIALFTCNHHFVVVMLKIKLDVSGNCLSACIL